LEDAGAKKEDDKQFKLDDDYTDDFVTEPKGKAGSKGRASKSPSPQPPDKKPQESEKPKAKKK